MQGSGSKVCCACVTVLMLLAAAMAQPAGWYIAATTEERNVALNPSWYYPLYDQLNCSVVANNCSYWPVVGTAPAVVVNTQASNFTDSLPGSSERINFTPNVTAVRDRPCISMDGAVFSNNYGYTLSVWYYPLNVTGAAVNQTIMDYQSDDEDYRLELRGNSLYSVLHYTGYGGLSDYTQEILITSAAVNEWNHVAVQIYDDILDNYYEFYVDGVYTTQYWSMYHGGGYYGGAATNVRHSVGCSFSSGAPFHQFEGYIAHYAMIAGWDWGSWPPILAGGPFTPIPTPIPTSIPTTVPTAIPTPEPTSVPTSIPTTVPTAIPTPEPTSVPTSIPTPIPTAVPTHVPTSIPSQEPTMDPTPEPTAEPSSEPTSEPSSEPSSVPTLEPTAEPTAAPTPEPTALPTLIPTPEPTTAPETQRSSDLRIRGALWGNVLSNETAVEEIKTNLTQAIQSSLGAVWVNITDMFEGSLIVKFTYSTLSSDNQTAQQQLETLTSNANALVAHAISVYSAINPGARDARLMSYGPYTLSDDSDEQCGDGCVAGIVIGSVLVLTGIALMLHHHKYHNAERVPYGENVDKV